MASEHPHRFDQFETCVVCGLEDPNSIDEVKQFRALRKVLRPVSESCGLPVNEITSATLPFYKWQTNEQLIQLVELAYESSQKCGVSFNYAVNAIMKTHAR